MYDCQFLDIGQWRILKHIGLRLCVGLHITTGCTVCHMLSDTGDMCCPAVSYGGQDVVLEAFMSTLNTKIHSLQPT